MVAIDRGEPIGQRHRVAHVEGAGRHRGALGPTAAGHCLETPGIAPGEGEEDAGGRISEGERLADAAGAAGRSEEHTSELQSLMRISYAVFCLKKKNRTTRTSDSNVVQYYIHQSVNDDE